MNFPQLLALDLNPMMACIDCGSTDFDVESVCTTSVCNVCGGLAMSNDIFTIPNIFQDDEGNSEGIPGIPEDGVLGDPRSNSDNETDYETETDMEDVWSDSDDEDVVVEVVSGQVIGQVTAVYDPNDENPPRYAADVFVPLAGAPPTPPASPEASSSSAAADWHYSDEDKEAKLNKLRQERKRKVDELAAIEKEIADVDRFDNA